MESVVKIEWFHEWFHGGFMWLQWGVAWTQSCRVLSMYGASRPPTLRLVLLIVHACVYICEQRTCKNYGVSQLPSPPNAPM